MLDTVLRLHFLSDVVAVFVGDSEETEEVKGFFGETHENTHRYPSLALSREMWESFDRPVIIRIGVTNLTEV